MTPSPPLLIFFSSLRITLEDCDEAYNQTLDDLRDNLESLINRSCSIRELCDFFEGIPPDRLGPEILEMERTTNIYGVYAMTSIIESVLLHRPALQLPRLLKESSRYSSAL